MEKKNVNFEDVVYFQEGPGVRNWQFRDSGIKLINIRNLVDSELCLENTTNYLEVEEVENKYKHFLLNAGDFVMASSGVTWGKIAEVHEEHLPLCLNTSIIRLVSKDTDVLDKWYLYYYIKSPQFRRQIERLITGSAQPNFGPSHLKKVVINLPEICNQREAVEQFTKVEAVINKRQKEIELLDDLIKARFVEMFGSIKEEQLLGDISEFVTVGIANSATHAYAESGIPMLRNQNIKENHLDDTDMIYIKPEFAAQYESKKLKENDIIAMRTGYPGVACLVPKKYEGCQTFTTLIVRLKEDNNPSYVCSYINSDLGKRFIDSEKVGVAQQNVGAKSLAKMPIKIAPKQLQDEYADFFNQVDKSKVAVQKALDETQLLFDSLMQEYFG